MHSPASPANLSAVRIDPRTLAIIVACGCLISMIAFCAGSALVAPRYFTALARDGFLPQWFGRRTQRGTPGIATTILWPAFIQMPGAVP